MTIRISQRNIIPLTWPYRKPLVSTVSCNSNETGWYNTRILMSLTFIMATHTATG
jgi:hypothetical protein